MATVFSSPSSVADQRWVTKGSLHPNQNFEFSNVWFLPLCIVCIRVCEGPKKYPWKLSLIFIGSSDEPPVMLLSTSTNIICVKMLKISEVIHLTSAV